MNRLQRQSTPKDAGFIQAIRAECIADPSQVRLFSPLLLTQLTEIPGERREHDSERTACLNFENEFLRTITSSAFKDSVSGRFRHLEKLAKSCLTVPVNFAHAEYAIPGINISAEYVSCQPRIGEEAGLKYIRHMYHLQYRQFTCNISLCKTVLIRCSDTTVLHKTPMI